MEAIIAINKLGVIGKNNKLPWKCSEDLKHFKKLTMGKSVVVGRKTFDKMPNLKGRAVYVASSENPLSEILRMNPDFIIGGKEIYEQTLHLCDVIHVSLINDVTDGDTYFTIPDELKERCIYYEFEVNE